MVGRLAVPFPSDILSIPPLGTLVYPLDPHLCYFQVTVSLDDPCVPGRRSKKRPQLQVGTEVYGEHAAPYLIYIETGLVLRRPY